MVWPGDARRDHREKKACVKTFQGHESDINSVAFFPDGHAFASVSDDSSCRLWDIRAYTQLNKYANDKVRTDPNRACPALPCPAPPSVRSAELTLGWCVND